jgi:drug/metabolite transporter (DMT)-like permease
MLLRRIRGILTSALVWGVLGALVGSVSMSIMALAHHSGSIHETWTELLDVVPWFFGYTATIGGLLALVVAMAERNNSIGKLTSRRFQLWGVVAGTLVGLGVATRILLESTPSSQTSLESLAFIVLAAAFSGAQGASLMLHVAQRSRQKVRA